MHEKNPGKATQELYDTIFNAVSEATFNGKVTLKASMMVLFRVVGAISDLGKISRIDAVRAMTTTLGVDGCVALLMDEKPRGRDA